MHVARALPRLAVYLAWTLTLLPVQIVAVALGWRLAERLPMFYHRGVCRIVGLVVERRGEVSQARPTLFASNHSSYLDISVLGALIPGSFVAKREVASWPLYGLLAKLQRSVFIERRAGRAARHRDEMGARLAAGDNLILFPEGTSSDGNRVLPFKSALFGVAERRVDGRPITVQPVSIGYSRCGGMPMLRIMRPFYAWYGDMELVGHFWRLLGLGPATVVVAFHPPVTIEAFESRKALTAHCEAVVAAGVSAAIHGVPPPVAAPGGPLDSALPDATVEK
ncbi:MAG: lysophospholipid acyltransferase family protein [Alphaproteobacteria bacterium]